MIEIYTADMSGAATGNNKLAGWRHLAVRVDSIETNDDKIWGSHF